MKAARTRELIIDVALDLFVDQGYDATTMEQIAERAEVGTTTLYRYFPSKDLLILDRFARSLNLGARLRERPAGEPLNLALGATIRATLARLDDADGRIATLRKIVDNAPVPRARLWDLAEQAQAELKGEIAERLHLPVGEVLVALTAHITFAVFQVVGEAWWDGDRQGSRAEVVDGMLRTIGALDLVVPSIPAATEPDG